MARRQMETEIKGKIGIAWKVISRCTSSISANFSAEGGHVGQEAILRCDCQAPPLPRRKPQRTRKQVHTDSGNYRYCRIYRPIGQIYWPMFEGGGIGAKRQTSFFFRSNLAITERLSSCVNRRSAHPSHTLHSELYSAIMSHRRSPEPPSQPSTQTGRDWPDNAA